MPDVVRTIGRYGVVSELGRGGMGVVYLARQLDLDRLVALKEMGAFHAADPAVARRFVRESRLAGSLSHPNVVSVFDFFEHEGAPYIAMEYVERGSLRPYVGSLELAQIGGVFEGLLAGLSAAEQRGIVHRDLKPENLLVTGEGAVKIADFGIAKATQGAQTSGFLTATGAALGTPAYMAPEQAMDGEIGPWTDLYAVGCIAYELFTDNPPFHDSKAGMAVLVRHVSDTIPPASEVADVDPDVSAWIERLTAKDPADRPASAADAWEQLEEILLALLGPRWRRAARLTDPPPPEVAPPAASTYESFAWSGPAPPEVRTPERIDVEGTGPDTPPPPEPLPQTAPALRKTPAPSPSPPDTGGERARTLARAGAIGILAALAIPLFTSGFDRWNVFAVLSPFEAVGIALGAWAAARSRTSLAAAAGALVGLGVLASVAALALLKFSLERLDPASVVLTFVVALAAAAILIAGIACVRRLPPRAGTTTPVDPGVLLLGLVGAALASAALFVNYDGFSSLWSEVGERESAEFFFEPMVAVVAMLVALGSLGTRPRFASALLLSVALITVLHFLGLLVAAWRAIGEVGEVRAAGFIGVLGGVVAAAAAQRRGFS